MNTAVNQIAETARPYALAAMRVVLGIVFVYHGWWKVMNFGLTVELFGKWGIPLPLPSAIAATVLEVGGGIALILGVGVAYLALPLAFTMLVAIVYVHFAAGFGAPKGYEYPLTLLVAVLAQGASGPGARKCDCRQT